MQRTRLVRKLSELPTALWNWSLPVFRRRSDGLGKPVERRRDREWIEVAWNAAIALTAAYALIRVGQFVSSEVGYDEILDVVLKASVTAVRVLLLIGLASVIWVPIGVWIGLRPRVAQMVQPVAQFLAAFPVNLVYPLVVLGILKFHLNVDIWTSPLMILGTQWYILFNTIAGASAIPTDLKDAAGNFGVKGWLRWKRMILPAIFPSYVTGAITASGGSWNVSISSEIVSWGDSTLVAYGVGAYITENMAKGDFPRIALGTCVMVLFVMLFNRQIWRRLYKLAEERWRIE
jgi:NitT/TauT family transport system permease protein